MFSVFCFPWQQVALFLAYQDGPRSVVRPRHSVDNGSCYSSSPDIARGNDGQKYCSPLYIVETGPRKEKYDSKEMLKDS